MDTEKIVELLQEFASWGDIIRGLIGLVLLQTLYIVCKDWLPKKVELSIGSFVVRRKYFDVQHVTNIVSANFYDGNQIPAEVRKEIIMLTCPKVRKLKKQTKNR